MVNEQLSTQVSRGLQASGIEGRDPNVIKSKMVEEFMSLKNIDMLTELRGREDKNMSRHEAFITRMSTPLYVDYPYIDKQKAIEEREKILVFTRDPDMYRDKEKLNMYLEVHRPILDYYNLALDPTIKVRTLKNGTKVFRKVNPPIVAKVAFDRLKVYRIAYERKGRFEMLKIIESTTNFIRGLFGEPTGQNSPAAQQAQGKHWWWPF